MIPKIIHYCWFGGKPLPEMALKCMESWKKFLPDYTVMGWNEDTFNVHQVRYVREAYEAGKFAFVADYARLYALFHHGGIYLDTDVEVIRNLDRFLVCPAFTGIENESFITTGLMGSEKGGSWISGLLKKYADRSFIRKDGRYDLTTNVDFITQVMKEEGFSVENRYQVYRNMLHVFPSDYFCPKSGERILTLTPNTHCIHHYAGSWQTPGIRLKKFFQYKILGARLNYRVILLKRKLLQIFK